jgi:hypothetical protein
MRAAGTGTLGGSAAAAPGSAATAGNDGGVRSARAGYKWAALSNITFGIQLYGGQPTGWASPRVLTELAGGPALLGAFGVIETKVADPMFRMGLFKIRAFTAGNTAALLRPAARGPARS